MKGRKEKRKKERKEKRKKGRKEESKEGFIKSFSRAHNVSVIKLIFL